MLAYVLPTLLMLRCDFSLVRHGQSSRKKTPPTHKHTQCLQVMMVKRSLHDTLPHFIGPCRLELETKAIRVIGDEFGHRSWFQITGKCPILGSSHLVSMSGSGLLISMRSKSPKKGCSTSKMACK